MLDKALILCFFHLLVIQATPTFRGANLPENFIIGGQNSNAAFQNVALIVSILETSSEHGYLSSGVLISPQHILTVAQAAHGFHRWNVGLGHINREMLTFYVGESAKIHSNFNPSNLNNNLAIILLTQSVPENIATPVAMPPEDLPPAGSYLYYGFGITNPNDQDALPNTLQQAFATELSLSQCQAVFGNQLVTEAMWCSQGVPNRGLCYGDQGGPLKPFWDDYLIGISSFWMPPCGSGLPNVFVRISHYREWINETIEGFN